MGRDGRTKGLYDFGTDAEAARRAAVVFWKYGFNQLGIVGGPHPAMVYPLADPRQAALDKVAPVPNPSPIGVLQDVTRTSLLFPGNVYGGPKSSLDVTKLEVVRRGEWLLVHGDDVLGRFGSVEFAARGAMKALQDPGRPSGRGSATAASRSSWRTAGRSAAGDSRPRRRAPRGPAQGSEGPRHVVGVRGEPAGARGGTKATPS